MNNNSRVCPTCKEEYPLSKAYWHKDKYREDGLTLHCKFCRRKNGRRYHKYGRTQPIKQTADGRLCPTCGLRYPATEEHWHSDRSDVSGWGWECKPCSNKRQTKARRESGIPEQESIRKDGLKRCSGKCKQWKPATMDYFSFDKSTIDKLNYVCRKCNQKKMANYWQDNREELLENQRRRYKENKEEILFKQKLYYEDNKDWLLEQQNQYYHNNKEWILEHQKQYNAKHRERINRKNKIYYRKHRKRIIQKTTEYAKNNRERTAANRRRRYRENLAENRKRSRIYAQNRRARVLELPNTFTVDEWERCLVYFENQCVVCGASADLFIQLDADHWIPISDDDCPGTVATNIVPLCSSKQTIEGQLGCNQSKTYKDPEEWLIERFGKRKAKAILKRIHEYFDWVRQQD